MDKKCSKYEALFTFGTEEDLLAHIKECPECAKEHEKMQKVSSLIQEVKPHFKKQRKNLQVFKIACTLLFLVFSSCSLMYMNTDISDTLKYGAVLSAEDLGLPVDSYGLIMVE